MKNINITLTDEEHEKLLNLKDGLSWHDFLVGFMEEHDDE